MKVNDLILVLRIQGQSQLAENKFCQFSTVFQAGKVRDSNVTTNYAYILSKIPWTN